MAVRTFQLLFVFLLLFSLIAAAEEWNALKEYPHAVLSNGSIEMSVFLTDIDKGFYRSTRFDWAGMVWQLTFDGHTYFVPRNTPHDPENNGHGMSLASEFSIGTNKHIPQRYPDAKAGETFMKVGAGILRKPADDDRYRFNTQYELVDAGTRTVTYGENWITYTHILQDEYGYAYTYTKNMELLQGVPMLVIRNSITNTGTMPILEDQYCHNFFTIDTDTIGPQYSVTLSFNPDTGKNKPPEDTALIEGNRMNYLKPVEKSFLLILDGYGVSPSDGRVIIENSRTGAGVDIGGDFLLDGFNLYTSFRAVCPELFVKIYVKPGETQEWTRTYRFYTK